MVSGTRALLIIFESYTEGSRAADPKGTKSCRTRENFRRSVSLSICPSIRLSSGAMIGDPNLDPGDPNLDPGDPNLDPGDPNLDPGDPNLDPGDPDLDQL